jgi:hypothetical protein
LAGLNVRELKRQIIAARDEREQLAREAYERSVADPDREVSQLRVIDGRA